MNINIRILAIAVLGIFSATHLLSAQDAVTRAAPGGDVIYRVAEVAYEIDGRTRPWAVEDILDLEEEMIFTSREELEQFLQRQQQSLINARVLQEATVTYEVIDPDLDASPDRTAERDVIVNVYVKDTWNFIVLPYFKYDSNTGLLLSLRTRDYNFFGTTQALSIDLDYERTETETDLFTIAADFRLPFNAFQRRWELILEERLEFEGDDVDFEIATGLGYYFDFVNLDWQAIYTESYRYLTDDPENDHSFFTSRFDLGTTIDLGVGIPGYGTLEYRPNAYSDVSYRPNGRISEKRRGLGAGFEHALGTGSFDWVGNYRRGQTFEVKNDNRYNISEERWSREITFQTAVYRSLWQRDPAEWPKAGVSVGGSGFYLIDGADEDQDDAAAAARGVLNDTMNGDLGLFLNLDAVITVWTLEPIFEAQFGTFFDIAYVRDLRGDFYDETAFESERDLRYGAGIEIVGFPLFARSLYIRGSLGFDLFEINDGTDPLSSDAREIFIGLGHHY